MNLLNRVRISPLRSLLCCAFLCSSLTVTAQVKITFQGNPSFTNLGNAAEVGDFNGDGKLDVIVNAAGGYGQQNAVLLGNGDGTFTPGATLPYPVSYVADLNGDGKLDILTFQSASYSYYVALGNGDGTFQPLINSNLVTYLLAIADINGDGKLDAVGTNGIFLGNGDGTFTAVPSSPSSSIYFVLGDFNGDGKVDIAFANPGTVTVMLGNGDGTFRSPVTSPGVADPSGIARGDLNGDGHVDLVVSDSTNSPVPNGTLQTFSLLGNGDGTFQAPGHPLSSYTLSNLLLADVNHDGKLDLIGNSFGAVDIYLGDGIGGFSTLIAYTGLPERFMRGNDIDPPLPITLVGDFDGDGNPDLVSGRYIYLGNGDGTFQGLPVLFPNSCPVSAVAADLNGDTEPDIVAIIAKPDCWNGPTYSLSTLLGDGKGGFSLAQTYPTEASGEIASGDLNADGKQDLVIVQSGAAWGVVAMMGNGDGTFGSPIVTSVGNSEYSITPTIAVADFNGDHKSDVALSGSDDNVYILISNGDGTFTTNQILLGIGSSFLLAEDFNGDGTIDLAVALWYEQGGDLAILLGNGDGTFQQPVITAASYPSSLFSAGDFNGDGLLDVVWGLTTFLGNGNGTFEPPISNGLVFSGGFGGQPLGSTLPPTDLDGDGRLDLIGTIVQGTPSDSTRGGWAGLGLGDGTFSVVMVPVPGPPLAVADFNLDMRPDVVLSNGLGMAVYINTSVPGSTLSLSPGNVSFGAQVVGSTSSANVVLQNTGGNPLSVTSIQTTISVGGTVELPVFNNSQNCMTSIAPGSTCTLTITFTPTIIGAASGYVTIFTNTVFSPQVITLTGTGEPALAISPASADFGTQALDTISSATAVLKNTGANPLYVTSIRSTTLGGGGGGASVFNAAQTCATSIAPGGTCTLTLTFAPTTIGAAMGDLSITDSIDSVPQVIPLAGTGAGLGMVVAGSTSATVTAGGTATYSLSLGGAAWSGQASITCTGLPKGASCSLPGPVSLSANQASSVTLNVTTTSRTMAMIAGNHPSRLPWIWAVLPLGVVAFPRRVLTKRRERYCGLVLLCPLLVSLVCSCGGSGGNSSQGTPQQNPNGTPSGTYQLVVTATSTFMNQSVNLTLNVQ